MDEFKFTIGDVVLAEWEDKLFYAKIQKIDQSKSYCLLIFDDNSVEECPFTKIHSVTETTAEIVCIICKDGSSAQPNEIVLCDKCGIGYHQKCHDPSIPAKAVEPDEPWMCTYCVVGAFCPYLENPFETKADSNKEHLGRRRLHAIQKEGSLSSGNSTEDEDRKQLVHREMSGYYYSSPSQHREGHKPKGRPSFRHKRDEKRGRGGSGRSPGRPTTGKERENQMDDMDLNSRKAYAAKHELQSRSHPRYSSPGRNPRLAEDPESSGSDRSRDSNTSSGRKCVEDTTKPAVVATKTHRRDGPREKQRLTQDLARQKRLLSEDIARAHQLQRVQVKNSDVAEKGDSPQSEYAQDSNKNLTESEREFTMYEKCYGISSPDYADDTGPRGEDSKSTAETVETDKGFQVNKPGGKSLFERVVPRSCAQETKNIEFVNDDSLEMRGGKFSQGSLKSETGKLSPSSQQPENVSTDKKEQLDLPIFENVTDDEFQPNDIGGNEYNNYVVNGLPSPSQLLLNNQEIDTTAGDNKAIISPADKSGNVLVAKDVSGEEACECASVEGDGLTADKKPAIHHFEDLNGLDHDDQSDHSIKINNVLEESNIQCEHSHRNTEELENQENIDTLVHDDGQSTDGLRASGLTQEATKDGSNENCEEQECEGALYEHESDASNNEGMSDAEETSESELASPAGRAKVRRKKRKKAKSAKPPVKGSSSPPRALRRSKSGRRLGRPPKTNKRLRAVESDSEDNGDLDFVDGDEKTPEESTKEDNLKESEHSNSPDGKLNGDIDAGVLEGEEFDDGKEEGGLGTPGSGQEDDKEGDGEEVSEGGDHSHVDSDTEDASQDIFTLTEAERQELEEQGRKERARKEKRIAARQKRKSEDRDKEKERSTPPHLVSQNRFVRDLPRHNWLVERLLQQNKIGQEALQSGSGNDKDDPDTNPDGEDALMKEELSPIEAPEKKESTEEVAVGKETSSGGEEPKEAPSSPQRDEFQSELHRSFIRRSFPSKVSRNPPKLKPSSPDHAGGSDKPPPPPLKHKLQPKELPTLEPLPKLKKIVTEKQEKTEECSQEKAKESALSPRESQLTKKSQSPIEILDDEEDKKKGAERGDSRHRESPGSRAGQSREGSASPARRSSFSPPKKGLPFSSPKRVVHSVSPTLPGSVSEIGNSMHMPAHHRAAILIPVVPMHDGNGIPLPPSLGPPSPHLNGRSPRTFTPQLITHNTTLSSAGIFGGPHPSIRYTNSCMHHMHPGLKPGQCKRDVNCPFHGASPRGMPPSGMLGMPSHHGPIPAFSQHGHDLSSMLAREHRDCDKGHCSNAECKLRHEKASPKLREMERGSGDKMATPKVVKPIAHVPGMRPPLMLSHLQQIGGQPPHGFNDMGNLSDEKPSRGLEPHAPHSLSKSPERSIREHERRPPQPLTTLSELHRRREHGGPPEQPIPGLKRPDFLPPSFTSPPGSFRKPGLIHPKDLFTSMHGPHGHSVVVSHADKRDVMRSMEEREHLENLLKSGPPRLRPLEEPRELSALRNYSESKREELAMRESLRARENAAYLRHLAAKEAAGIPPAKLFDERTHMIASRESFNLAMSRANKEHELRLMATHGNASIMGLRGMEERTPGKEEERKGANREDDMATGRHGAPGESETRDREIREDQAMKELERRRSIDLMHEKEQEKRMNAEREAIRNQVMNRERQGEMLLRGADAENHFKAMFRLPRDSPPFMRRGDFYTERLMQSGDMIRPEHRLDLRAAAMQDLQRRQEAMRVGDPSHREILGRMASAHKPGVLERHFSESTSRGLTEVRSHSPLTSSRSFPLSLASRQAMDRLAAAAQGKQAPGMKEDIKDIPPHLRAEVERERERERHRLSVEQIEANRRLLQAELKDKVNPLALNRDMGPRDREKEVAALRARERLILERERLMAIERITEERKRKREMGEPEVFGPHGRRISPPQFGMPLDRAEYERVKRLKTGMEAHGGGPRPPFPHPGSHPMEGKPKDERMEQRVPRPMELDLPGKNPNSALERESLWMRERERALRAREELSRMKAGMPQATHMPPGFASAKERAEGPPREGKSRGKGDEEGVNLCSVCKRDASFLCSGCQGAWYCSSECQLSAWSKHSRDCGQSQRQ